MLEYIVKSYLCGKFNKVAELFDLHKSLVYSISKSVFLLDKLWLSFVLSSANSWDQIGNSKSWKRYLFMHYRLYLVIAVINSDIVAVF